MGPGPKGGHSGGNIYEQRAEPRFLLSSFVTWRYGDNSCTGQVLDICRGGMKIKSRSPMPLLGELHFISLGATPFDLAGQVKWISRVNRNFKFGVQFISLSRAQVRYLEDKCLSKLSQIL